MNNNKTKVSDAKKLDALLVDFFIAVSFLETEREASLFLSDLLSDHEIMQMAKRLRIAILLASGHSYSLIRKRLGVGLNTIVKVSTWLERQGEGYKIIIARLAEIGKTDIYCETSENGSVRKIKRKKARRKYAECLWPAELISAIGSEVEEACKK